MPKTNHQKTSNTVWPFSTIVHATKNLKEMKHIITLIAFLFVLSSCGNGNDGLSVEAVIKNGTLSELKAKKSDLDQQQQELEAKIALLEAKIQEVDTSASSGKPVLVKVDTLSPQKFEHFIAVQGSISSEENIMVSPEIPGVITKVFVEEGDHVQAGQLMAIMDASALKSQLQQIKSSYDLAKTTYERRANLWEQNIGSEMQLLQSKSSMESLQSQMDAVKAQIANASMVSPVNGVVDDVHLKLGEMANPGVNGIRVVNMSELKVKATLADRYAANVKKGDEVKIFLPNLNDTIIDKLSFVSQVIDPQSRSITIEAKLGNKNQYLKPNMMAKLEINNYTADSATVVPSNVLLQNPEFPDNYYLMGVEKVGNDFIAKRFDVKIGEQYSGQTEIISGLPENTTIITFGFGSVAEGQRIKFNK